MTHRMVPLSAVTGEETWDVGSALFKVFSLKFPDRPTSEEALAWAASRADNPMITSLRNQQIMPSVDGRKLELGKWRSESFEVAEGSILKVVGNRTAKGWGDAPRRLQKLIRVRAAAPLYKVSMHLSQLPGRGTLADANVYGRFDVITMEEAEIYGCRINPRFKHLFSDTYGDVLDVRMVEPALAPPEEITVKETKTATGETVKVGVVRRSRQVGLTNNQD